MSKITVPYSGSGQMCASACFTKRFSQAVSWWCPPHSALYSFDSRTVVQKKNQEENRLHGKKMEKNTEKIIDFPIHLPYICHRNLSQFSVRPPGRASACFVKRFSQAVSWWCPLESAPYSLLGRTVLQKKKQNDSKFCCEKISDWFFHTNLLE